jgi:hypothetical protein
MATDKTISKMANGYPKSQFNSGIILKFIPYKLAIKVGGIKTTEATVNIFMILFCSIFNKPKKVFCKYSNLSKPNSE